MPASKAPHPASKHEVQQLGDPIRTDVSFADPLSSDQPLALTSPAPGSIGQPQAPTPPPTSSVPSSIPFSLHHIPEDQVGAAKEAMIQAGVMMDRLKVVYDTSKAVYDARYARQANV